MKNKTGTLYVACILGLVCTLMGPGLAFGQNAHPPILSITPQSPPEVSLYGLAGARYELQYAPTLDATNWLVLTNFILGTSPYTIVDSSSQEEAMRMYRALLLETNASSEYAPTSLDPADIFQFEFLVAGIPVNHTLVINSATNGVLLQVGSPGSGMALVRVEYARVNPFLAQLSLVQSPSSTFPAGQTNFYTLVFTGPWSGFVQFTDGVMPGTVGEFWRDRSLIGQQLAPAQLTGGESYRLLTTNQPTTNLTTLVVNSPTSGMLITSGDPPPGIITPVSITYQRLGPLSSQMEVVIPPSIAFPTPQTNLYILVYWAPNAGSFQGGTGAAMVSQGSFTRDDFLIGQQLAPAQLVAGESYRFSSSNGPSVLVEAVVATSATDCILVSEGTDPESGIYPDVALQYLLLSDLSCQMQLVIPPTPPMTPSYRTNVYLLVYSAPNSGYFQRTSDAATISIGQFLRNPAQ